MNISNKRDINTIATELIPDIPEILSILLGWNGQADNFAACFIKPPALHHSCRGVHGMSIGHGLYPNRLIPSQFNGSKGNFTC